MSEGFGAQFGIETSRSLAVTMTRRCGTFPGRLPRFCRFCAFAVQVKIGCLAEMVPSTTILREM